MFINGNLTQQNIVEIKREHGDSRKISILCGFAANQVSSAVCASDRRRARAGYPRAASALLAIYISLQVGRFIWTVGQVQELTVLNGQLPCLVQILRWWLPHAAVQISRPHSMQTSPKSGRDNATTALIASSMVTLCTMQLRPHANYPRQ